MYHLEGKKYLLLLIILYLLCRLWFAVNLIMPIISDYNHQLTVVIYRVWKMEGESWVQSRYAYIYVPCNTSVKINHLIMMNIIKNYNLTI